MKIPKDFNNYDEDKYDDYDDGNYDDYDVYRDEDLSEAERDSTMKTVIGYGILSSASEEEKDDIEFLAQLYELYNVNLDYIMSCASKRITDLYDVGNIYLSPLFSFETEKYNYIISMLKQWDLKTNKKEIYGFKNVLTKIYKTSPQYANYALKYVNTRTQYCEASIIDKLKKFIKNIKLRLCKPKMLTEEDRQLLVKVFNELISGEKAKKLLWIINYNQEHTMKLATEQFDEELREESFDMDEESMKIICRIDTANKILHKPRLNENDKQVFNKLMEEINNYIKLSERQETFIEKYNN